MHKRKQLQYAVVGVLGFALLFMTIGFAAYAQLVSNDTASATSNFKAVHKVGFDADSYLQSEESVEPSVKTITGDTIDFSVRLEHPGDTYAAVINIVNHSNVTEIVDQIRMSVLDEKIADKIDYRVTFDDEDYIGTSYEVGVPINRGESARKQMFITVSYKDDAKDDGPVDLNLSAGVAFAEDEE